MYPENSLLCQMLKDISTVHPSNWYMKFFLVGFLPKHLGEGGGGHSDKYHRIGSFFKTLDLQKLIMKILCVHPPHNVWCTRGRKGGEGGRGGGGGGE